MALIRGASTWGLLLAALLTSGCSDEATTQPPPTDDAALRDARDDAQPRPDVNTGDGQGIDSTPDPTDAALDLPNDTGEPLPDLPIDVSDTSSPEDTATDVAADATLDVTVTPDGGSDADLPDPSLCPAVALEDDGTWTGWANFQWPARTTATVGTPTEQFYGQVWRQGDTAAAGQAPGWSAELLVGPLGSLPSDASACWRRFPATYNTDQGNNDEYQAQFLPWATGLFGLAYRYRPPGEGWKTGDLDGSDNGVHPLQTAVLEVTGGTVDSLRVVTLNLRCQADDWPARRPLVVRALVELAPDLVAFQEDCAVPGQDKQSVEIRSQLAMALDQGYELITATTHQGEHDGQTYDEGIALMSRLPIVTVAILDLPYAVFPRKALRAEIEINGQPIFFYGTHFDYSSNAGDARVAAAEAILTDLSGRPGIVVGDLNATPTSSEVGVLAAALTDAWAEVGSGAGLTMPANHPTRRIDYIFVSAGAGTVTSVGLIDESEGSTMLSDHLGVSALLSL